MAAFAGMEDFIKEKIEKERWTHKQVLSHLQEIYPSRRGFSIRSLERFCSDNNIHKTPRMSALQLDEAVTEAVALVGPTYGRKTMTGLLSSSGLRAGEQRVRESLQRCNPIYHQARRTETARLLNPIPYRADYFGHKLHCDQNEKLIMFGVTHVCGIDGFSRKIVGFVTMPVKNNLEIYKHFFRPILLQYGLWDQIRVDHGKEWVLMLYVQEHLAHMRRNIERPPHLQTTSKQNHSVERIWVEINARVNYPVKACLIEMEEQNEFNLDCSHERFCVSWFTIRVAAVGTRLTIESWNEHPIPGPQHGIPNVLMYRNNQAVQVEPQMIPQPEEALQLFESHGGNITRFSQFGEDPLKNDERLFLQRETMFSQRYPDFENFSHTVVNNDYSFFRAGLLYFISVSKHFQAQMDS